MSEERAQPVHFALAHPDTGCIGDAYTPADRKSVACQPELWDGVGSRTLIRKLVTCPACSKWLADRPNVDARTLAYGNAGGSFRVPRPRGA